ncbi:MAG: phosphoribosylanthranilate isomerase [Arcanobacterium sp.]|nr:phosphoribosylanthranilate isomerase [Arcanobacterium sp.]
MTLVKTCGMSRDADIIAVNKARPDFVGFVFAPSSRQVTFERAAHLRARLDSGITPVGVFVNAPVAEVSKLVNDGVIDVAQLHGDEDENYIKRLRRKLSRGEIIQVFRIGADCTSAVLAQARDSQADMVMLDRYDERRYGGSGQSFDWSAVGDLGRDFFLAGGISAATVSAAIAELHPYAVDASSALEKDGAKDAHLICKFVSAVRREDARRRCAGMRMCSDEDVQG